MAESKQFLTRNSKGTPHVEVYVEGGGEVPEVLSGIYTSDLQAQKSIELYLSTRRKKVATNATDSGQ